MSTVTLTIFCLTTSNLPWFMDLTFQVPMQYCSLQHGTLLPSPVTSTARLFFFFFPHFCSVSSFFLELFPHSSPVAYWAPPTWGVHLSVSYLLPFHTLHGVLKARILKWFVIAFSIAFLFFSILGNNSDILIIRAWIYLWSVMIQFIMVNKIPKCIRIEKSQGSLCF